jgi:hypothetical protein
MPPDRDIDAVEAVVVVIEEPLVAQQLELGKKHLRSRQGRSGGRGGGPKRTTAKNKSMLARAGPTEEGLHSLMQLAQGRIAAHRNSSPNVRAGPAQHDSKLICVNLLI